MPECLYVKTAVFELVQQFYHATEIGNVANAVSTCADQPYQIKQKAIVSNKLTCRGTQS